MLLDSQAVCRCVFDLHACLCMNTKGRLKLFSFPNNIFNALTHRSRT